MKASFKSTGELILTEVKGSEIVFRHLSGVKDMKNKYGETAFSVEISDELAEELNAKGWKVSFGKEKADGNGKYSSKLKVDLYFDSPYWKPTIRRYSSSGSTIIDKGNVIDIESDQIESAAMVIRPRRSRQENGGDGMIHAKLKNMRYKLEEDDLAGVYDNDTVYDEPPMDHDEDELPFE